MTPRRQPKSKETPTLRPRVWMAGAGLAIAAAAVLAIVLRDRGPLDPVERAGYRDNVLLITLDTARADRLGAYGYTQARTEHLDRLAAEGVRFELAFSPAPLTLPAHASMFTGLYPFSHGVRNNGNFYLSDRYETLATMLKKQGYRTGAFVSSFILDRRYGLARGFDTYDDQMQGADRQIVSLEAERRGDRTALALGRWLEAYATGTLDSRSPNPEPGSPIPGPRAPDPAPRTPNPEPQPPTPNPQPPFFAWLHLYDPHEPYRPPPPFRDAFAESPYDGEMAFDSAIVASVLDKLGQLGLRDRTLIAIIGDHGESLGDHGEETHSMFVYEAAIRVPFILWRPGVLPPGTVVREPVRATDLAATILDLVGAPPLATKEGRSLRSVIEGGTKEPAPAIYAETLLPQFYMNWAPLRTIRDERWKLIDAPRPELFDLARDPGERQNRYDQEPRRARALRQQLDALTGGAVGAMNPQRLDREALEKLAALGYVAAGADPPAPGGPDARADPKDVIAVFNRLRRANSAVRDRRFDEALPILENVLRENPRNAFARLVLGSANMGMGRNREAIEHYQLYLKLVPTSAYAHQWMAICYLRLGDRDSAMREAEAALAIDPRFTDARVLRGGVLAARGAYDAAVRELRAAVETDPAKPVIRLDLAKVLAEAGRGDEAEREYRRILELQPDYTPAFTGLGALYARQGRLEAALEPLRQAVRLSPMQNEARYNLAQVLERQGRRAEAEAEYRRLAEDAQAAPAIRSAALKGLGRLRR